MWLKVVPTIACNLGFWNFTEEHQFCVQLFKIYHSQKYTFRGKCDKLKLDDGKSEFWLFVTFHGWHFENGLREAIYTQILTFNMFACY